MNGHRALDGKRRVHGLGVHHAVGGGPGGELVLPVVAGDAVRVVVAVDGGGAGLGDSEVKRLGGLPGGVSVPGFGVVAVLGGDGGHVLGAVLHAVEVVAEPAVQDLVVAGIADVKDVAAGGIGGRQVAVLMQEDLHVVIVVIVLREGVVHQLKLLGPDVVVVETVDDESGAVDLRGAGSADGAFPGGIHSIVPDLPGIAVQSLVLTGIVAVQTGLLVGQFPQIVAVALADGGVVIAVDIVGDVGLLGGGLGGVAVQVAAGAVGGQGVGIGGAGTGGDALGVGVLIPAGDTGHGDDGLQARDTGGGETELGGAGVGTAGHAHLAVGPVGLDGDVAGLVGVGVAVGIAVEPLDDALEGVDLQVGAAGLIALGAPGAQAAALHHGVAPDQVVVIPFQVLVVHHVLEGVVVVPVGGLGLRGGLRGGGDAFGNALGGGGVEVVDVEVRLSIVAHAPVGAAGDVGPGLVDGGGFVVAFRGGLGDLDQSLHQVQLAVAIGIVVGLHVDAVTGDVAGLVAVAGGDGARGVGENGLGHAVDEEGFLLFGGLVNHQSLIAVAFQESGHPRPGAGLVGAGAVLIQHAQAVRQGHAVGIAAQLAVLQPGEGKQRPQDGAQGLGLAVLGLQAVGGQVRVGDKGAASRVIRGQGRRDDGEGQSQCQQECQQSFSHHAYTTSFVEFSACLGFELVSVPRCWSGEVEPLLPGYRGLISL